jgi:hypothetical protein
MKNEKPNDSQITPKVVLEELFVLLEEYGPAWYGEEQHDRALLALNYREEFRTKSEIELDAPGRLPDTG